MRRVAAIAGKDLRQVLRDRRAAVFLLLMPLAFTLFFGLAFSGMGAGSSDARLQLGVVDRDGSVLSRRFVGWLAQSGAVRPEPLDALRREYAADLVRRGDDAGVLGIPFGWGASVASGQPQALTLIADAGTATGLAASRAVDGVLQRFLLSERAARVASEVVAARLHADPAQLRAAALDRALAGWRDAPVTVSVAEAGRPAAAAAADRGGFGANPYNQASPGMIVQFAVYGLLLSAMVLVIERKQGALGRLLASPTPRAALLAGHALAMVTVVLVQILVLEAFGQLAFGVAYLRAPAATLLLTLALALWSASLGLVIGAFARSEPQVVASGLLAMFLFSGLGGAWFPLEVAGRTFATVGHVSPTAWAMDAYRAILLRGAGLAGIALPLTVLLASTALFAGVALVRLARPLR